MAMAREPLLSMSAIFMFFNETKIIEKGENSIKSGFVHSIMYDDDLLIIRGNVHASMKQKLYKVEVFLKNGQIEKCTCQCPRGLDICHHMAALAIFSHSNISKTDAACQWNKQKGSEDNIPLTAEKCFSTKENCKNIVMLTEEISQSSINNFVEDLKLCGPNGLGWILSSEPQEDLNVVVDVQELIFSKAFIQSKDKTHYIMEKLKIDSTTIKDVYKKTMGQSTNPLWLIVRKHRITASNFGKILKASARSRYPISLFETLTGSYCLDGIKQIQWGRNHEIDALQCFEKKHNMTVEKCGIFLDPCGYLGASPDAVCGDSLIEVKCPFKYRNDSLTSCLLNKKDYILSYDGETFKVNVQHNYYHQIQGQLYIANKSRCILILWTTIDFIEFTIKKDDDWEPNLNILKEFYLTKYIDYILK